jgi:HSP20 family protein
MLPLNNPFDSFFHLQQQFDRMFDQFWNDLPARTTRAQSSFQVQSSDDEWRIDVPLPGIDPKDVSLEVAGNTLTIRAGQRNDGRDHQQRQPQGYHYEQTLTIPQFLDLDRIAASHHHGMLRLTVPIKESVKPRRIQIAGVTGDRELAANNRTTDDRKQLTTA